MAAAASLFVLFLAWHNDDFRDFSATTIVGTVVVAFYCSLIGLSIGIAAAVFQLAWKRWGGRALWPPAGALCGGLVFGAASLIAWQSFGPNPQSGGGVHGGGDVAAMLVLGSTAILGIVGAVLGGLLGVLIAAISKRRS